MQLLDVGGLKPSGKIDGKGIATFRGSSPRVYYSGTWKNVEFSADVKCMKPDPANKTGGVEQSYLVARSNHEDRNPDGFGGYYLYVSLKDKKIFFKKEITHKDGYSSRLGSVECDVKADEWYNQKIVVKNLGENKVKLEGYFNGELMTSITDDGKIWCGKVQNTPPFLNVGKWCFTRANNLDELLPGVTAYRNVIITPLPTS